jgi:hypothetical protein
MAQPERPSYLPPLLPLWERTQFIPDPPGVSASQPAVAPSELPAPTEEIAAQTTPPTTETRTKQPAVTLTGRVAALPSFRTTPKSGQLVARFPLAVHEAKGGEVVTTYHQVIAFGARAEKLRESLALGEEVQVMGYRHEGTTKGGKPTVEYYLAALRRPKPPPP